MELKIFVAEVFQSVDRMDAPKFASFFVPEGIFRFANNPAVEGNKAIEAFVGGFFQSLKGISHSNLESWQAGEAIFVNGTVTYLRHNDTKLEVPFSCTWKMLNGLIDEYLVFVDSSELYQ
jgi:hypothetical protein